MVDRESLGVAGLVGRLLISLRAKRRQNIRVVGRHPMWAQRGLYGSANLEALLAYSSAHHARHIDWFLRHKENGVRLLLAILTVESAIGGLTLSGKIDLYLSIVIILMLVVVTIPMSSSFKLSCRRNYQASLEHTALTAKIIWAMGLGQQVSVDTTSVKAHEPFASDKSMYVPRYYEDAYKFADTEAYVQHHLSNKANTLHAAERILTILCLMATCFGFGIAIAIAVQLIFGEKLPDLLAL